MTVTAIAGIVMIALIFVTLAFGFPIGLSIGLGSAAALFIIMPNQGFLTISAQKMFQSVNSFSLLAIPFFVLAGNIMNTGGIARRLVGCAKLVAHRLPGALAQTNIVANMLFGAMSGSGVAAAVAMGGILGPMEKEDGYSDEYIAVCNIASGPTGMMIPPSNIMIVYSTVAGSVSIAALFMAGYIPGILWGLGCMIVAGVMAKKRGYVSTEHYNAKFVLKTLWDGIPYGIGFIKNKYIGRTFIQGSQKQRENSVRIKLNVVSSTVKGKRVVLVDDSIVRGTTSARIIKLLRDAGATEVHFMVSAPPFKYPCYFGTDIPDQKLLVATGRTVEQINEVIGADTLGYLSTEHVVQLTKNAKCGFCTACFTGEYAVKPDEVLSTDIHERHLNDRPKDEKKLGE